VTTHVVRLKLFRLKAEGVRRAPFWRFGEETADFCIKHGFKVCSIPIFPNPASRGTFSLSTWVVTLVFAHPSTMFDGTETAALLIWEVNPYIQKHHFVSQFKRSELRMIPHDLP